MSALTGNQPPIQTVQQQAVQFERDVASAAQAIRDLYAQCLELQARQAVNDYVTKLNNADTYTLDADGSVGATDGEPNTAHPIVGLNVSAAAISAALGYGVGDFVAWYTGGSPAVTDRRAVVGALLP